ncbi:MAG: hypothetical protein QGI83_14415, partial [Candidatus Latescibacteria bacterium]|nr:hypothetical protein [Candidatus Latescibacterota bacterium]
MNADTHRWEARTGSQANLSCPRRRAWRGTAVLMVTWLIVGTVGPSQAGGSAEVKHPVYLVEQTEKGIRRLKNRVKPIMAMSEEEMVALVPDRNGFRFMGCPACDEGTQEGQL